MFAPEINMPNFVDTGELISLTIALLGMGGLHGWERQGVARENMKVIYKYQWTAVIRWQPDCLLTITNGVDYGLNQ